MKRVLLSMLVCMFAVSNAQSQDRSRFASWMYQDARDIASSFNQRSSIWLFSGGLALSSLSAADPAVMSIVGSNPSQRSSSFFEVSDRIGHRKMKYPAMSIFAASLLTNNSRFQDASFTAAQSVLYAEIISSGLKTVFGRARPDVSDDPHNYSFFSGEFSFPSGHTATAFALVTPWVMYYPGPVTYSMMALSTGTAVSRVVKEKHWPTDVIAGAAIGFFTGRYLARRHMEAQGSAQPRVRLAPAATPSSVGFSVVVRVD